jgi:nicotinate-nucleotide--dimethylbenzimidazole phosphoribosyltransferase
VTPDWLAVPAADRAALPAWRASAPDGSNGWRNAHQIRAILVGDGYARIRIPRNAGMTASLGAKTPVMDADVIEGLMWRLDLDSEILDPGTPGQSGGIFDDPRDSATMDKHRLDVALSLGRHAAERAKLAGCDLLIVAAVGKRETALTQADLIWRTSVAHDPYEALRHLGSGEIAALVGAMIAGAQIGVPVLSRGAGARLAALVASCLHPNLGDWLILTGSTTCHLSAGAKMDLDSACSLVHPSLMVEVRSVAARKIST